MTRICACCPNPITRNPGEDACNYGHRRTCSRECGYRLRSQTLRSIGLANRERPIPEPEMPAKVAAKLLSRIPPRLLPRFEELPPPERAKALAGWGCQA
jgi:hypothetical protein